uniref:Uncharacterized protein n=1 Tax=viral metagenome TaxID=1070528 RepID=A0A6M3LCA6_9ZZZZ
MKAKDTVMGDNDTVYIAENGTAYTIAILKSQCVSNVNPKWVNENIDLIREAQAAMSFRAGIKEGYNAGLDDATHDAYNAGLDEGKQVSTEAVRGVLDYVESMFPELESTYWQGKNWKRFRKEQALSEGK